MQKPDSNLLPDSQPWGRWAEGEVETLTAELARANKRIEQLIAGGSDPVFGVQIAELQKKTDLILQQLISLYASTGNSYPPAPPAPTPPPPAPDKVVLFETRAEWSRTWGTSSYYTGSGEYTNGTYLYQGSNPEDKVGMFRFNMDAVRNKKIKAASVYLANISAPWSSVFVATLGTHGNVVAPEGKPGRENGFDIGWSRGENKWFPIPSWAFGGLSNGSVQGFTVGASGPSDANSAFFKGVGTDDAPIIRIEFYT